MCPGKLDAAAKSDRLNVSILYFHAGIIAASVALEAAAFGELYGDAGKMREVFQDFIHNMAFVIWWLTISGLLFAFNRAVTKTKKCNAAVNDEWCHLFFWPGLAVMFFGLVFGFFAFLAIVNHT